MVMSNYGGDIVGKLLKYIQGILKITGKYRSHDHVISNGLCSYVDKAMY